MALVRHALMPAMTLVPYRDELRERYRQWLEERDTDNSFTPEQREWLDRMAEHIATSLAIAPEDFEAGWFGQHGSLGRAHALFGDKLKPLESGAYAELRRARPNQPAVRSAHRKRRCPSEFCPDASCRVRRRRGDPT